MQPQNPTTTAGECHIVRHDEGGKLVLAMEPLNQSENGFCRAVVQVTRGLVGQQYLRSCHERPGQGHTLLLPARQLAGAMVGAVLQAYFPQPLRRFTLRIAASHRAQQQRHGNVLQGGEFRQKIVKLLDKPDFAVPKIGRILGRERVQWQLGAVYVTLGRPIKRTQDVQQSTLAGSRLADDRQHLSLPHSEGQIFK